MALTSTQKDFVIYDEEFNSALYERLQVNIDVWNAATYGALVITTDAMKGHFSKVSMYKALASDVVKEYNPENVTTTAFDTFESFEQVKVKVWRDSNIQKTVDAFKVLLLNPDATFSQLVGGLTADLITKDAIETLLSSILGAIENDAAHVLGDGTTFPAFKDINKAQFVYGDQFSNVACILTHSNTAQGIVDLNIDEKLDTVAGFTISTGKWHTLNIPMIIADLDALKDGANYKMAFLTAGAGVCVNSETVSAYTDIDLDSRPAMMRFKREWAYNIGVKGYSYDTTKGNYPTKAVLANKTSWKKVVSDDKELPCVVFKAKAV